MKADLRISVKDYHRRKNLKIMVVRTTLRHRQLLVRMNGDRWPGDGRPASLTKVLVSILEALVRSV